MISTIKSLVNPKKKKNYKVVAFTIPLNGASNSTLLHQKKKKNSTLLHQSLGLDSWLYIVRFKKKNYNLYTKKWEEITFYHFKLYFRLHFAL